MIRMENDGNSLSGGNVTGQGNPRSSVSLLDNKTSSISWTNDVRVRAVSSVLEEIFTWSTISQWFYFLLFEPNLKLAAPPNLIKIQPRVKNSSSFQRHVSRATKLSLSLSPISSNVEYTSNWTRDQPGQHNSARTRMCLRSFHVPAWPMHGWTSVRAHHTVTLWMCESECVRGGCARGVRQSR